MDIKYSTEDTILDEAYDAFFGSGYWRTRTALIIGMHKFGAKKSFKMFDNKKFMDTPIKTKEDAIQYILKYIKQNIK